MKQLFVAVTLLLALPGPALAHKLKVFVAVRDDTVTGYAFFVGGDRPRQVPYVIKDASGQRLDEGTTDDEGRFSWPAPAAIDYTVTVNTGDGHTASATISANRFMGGTASTTTTAGRVAAASGGTNDMVPASEVESLVARAVQREVLPLLERIEEMDNRMRLTDILSGMFFIIGASGGILWLNGRRGAA